MKVALTFLSLILVACGTDHKEPLPPANVEALNLYASLNPDNISIGFGDPQGKAMGECIKTSNQNFIIIDESAWKVLNSQRRKALILHELGHCVYNREHETALDSNDNPVTIMYPGNLNNEQALNFERHEQHYINELIY